ncbi:uncharacterized protein LOC108207588 [Daucus carota subsp. sativus]|uniref:uncharacterized protein LOC108207588 n=1 Tax=Daucus carota subsp. sativus TaxID=79200 RepID=UPI0007EF3793|nr:PREDICTED: uncharacterized protein LOC108207588 [Daucus carota subsp. sativus]
MSQTFSNPAPDSAKTKDKKIYFALYDPAIHFPDDQKTSDENFNLFHTSDRTLFYRLVHKLGRDVSESMRVVAFLIWLEKAGYSQHAIHKLMAWPFYLLEQVADEIAVFSSCLGREFIGRQFICLFSVRKLCSLHIDLFEFHANRIGILEGVEKIVSEICMRAFKDILTGASEFKDDKGDEMWYDYINPSSVQPTFYHNCAAHNFTAPSTSSVQRAEPQPRLRVGIILKDPNANQSQKFGGMQLGNGGKNKPDEEPDERTILLTFSKGCCISEVEIREFFTRIFGDFIEEIFIQDVASDEQPSYARMVCRSSAMISTIAPPNRKTKYTVNGKHILATKYVKGSRR